MDVKANGVFLNMGFLCHAALSTRIVVVFQSLNSDFVPVRSTTSKRTASPVWMIIASYLSAVILARA